MIKDSRKTTLTQTVCSEVRTIGSHEKTEQRKEIFGATNANSFITCLPIEREKY